MLSSIKVLQRDHFNSFKIELNQINKLLIISPFITEEITQFILSKIPATDIKLITRYNTLDFFSGVSDLNALKVFFNNGTKIRGVYKLHSKLYIFDNKSAIITSANFTSAGMMSNMEFGLLVKEKNVVKDCIGYFNLLWVKANNTLTDKMILQWEKKINEALKQKIKSKNDSGLGDEGNDCFDNEEINNELKSLKKLTGFKKKKAKANSVKRYFIKYIGATDGRKKLSAKIAKDIKDSECNKKIFYSYHPGQISDGDIVYFGRMTKNPNDYAIMGKGIGLRHNRTKDIVSKDETKIKKWKNKYRYFNKIHSAEFINGTLNDCVLLTKDIISKFNYRTLVTTLERWNKGERNIVVSRSLMQKQFVEITPQVAKWLDKQLDKEMQMSSKIVK